MTEYNTENELPFSVNTYYIFINTSCIYINAIFVFINITCIYRLCRIFPDFITRYNNISVEIQSDCNHQIIVLFF